MVRKRSFCGGENKVLSKLCELTRGNAIISVSYLVNSTWTLFSTNTTRTSVTR